MAKLSLRRKTNTDLKKVRLRKWTAVGILIFLSTIGIVWVGLEMVPRSVYFLLKKRLHLKVQAQIEPCRWSPCFELEEIKEIRQQEGRWTLHSGRLKVTYDLKEFFPHRKIAIKLEGEGLSLEGRGLEEMGLAGKKIKEVSVNMAFTVGQHGLEQISEMEIYGPSFQFHVHRADT